MSGPPNCLEFHQQHANYLQVPTHLNTHLNDSKIADSNFIQSSSKIVHRSSPNKLPQFVVIPHSASHQEQNSTSDVFKSIKDMIYDLSTKKTISKERVMQESIDKQIQQTKTMMSLSNQISYLRQTLSSHEEKMKKSQQTFEKAINQNQNRHRKEIKKYIDLVSDRQNEIQNLKKSIKSLTTRNLSLTSELESLVQTNQTLQNTIQKSIESFRSNIKQFNYSLQQNQLDKVVLQGKYKQLCDKIQQVIKQSQQSENMKNKVQRKYEKLKENYEVCRNQCVQLRFQIQRNKIKARDFGDWGQQKNRNEFVINDNKFENWAKEGIQNVKQTVAQLVGKFNTLSQIEQKILCLDEANKKFSEMVRENQNLKMQLYQKQLQNDEIQLRLQGRKYEDQIIAERNPSLYQILCEKKAEIEKFQKKIEYLQKMALFAEQELKIIAESKNNYKETQQKGTSYSQEQQKRMVPKAKFEEILRELDNKQKVLLRQRQNFEKTRENDKMRIKQLQQQVVWLRRETQRLKLANENNDKEKKQYKQKLQEMIEDGQPKKKQGKKTKNKLKCPVCSHQISNQTRSYKCPQCFIKTHSECSKNHECKEVSDTDSYQQDI